MAGLPDWGLAAETPYAFSASLFLQSHVRLLYKKKEKKEIMTWGNMTKRHKKRGEKSI